MVLGARCLVLGARCLGIGDRCQVLMAGDWFIREITGSPFAQIQPGWAGW